MTTYPWNPLSPVREGNGLNVVVHPYPYRVDVERALTAIVEEYRKALDDDSKTIEHLLRCVNELQDRGIALEARLATLEGKTV